ncbi:MAG TPA: FAD-dependent oxidoreductase, partial [Vicinamibacterales bacterium]|nr:FAD-dependent oxidoreductase [Vicinamibacterales bacterium]
MSVSSYWVESAERPRFPALNRDLDVDVAVIGAGITGLTTAYLLKQAGRKVAVIDRDRIGGVDTMRTTAHVTCVTDVDLPALVKAFGRDHAQAAWDAGLAARDEIDAIVRDEEIACDWTRVRGYKHAPKGLDPTRDLPALQEEAALARELGFSATFVERVPGIDMPGIAFDEQAKIHPGKYLARLAALVDGDGSFVFEGTSSEDVTDEPLTVTCGRFTITPRYLVIATHTPLVGKTNLASAILLQTKLYLYTSYVVAGRIPSGELAEGLYWDTADPYHYVRVDRGDGNGYDLLIFGGEDHKTGQVEDTAECFRRLEFTAREWFPRLQVTHRWSGQVIETNDGLPFIGETAANQFAATGFAGNGMTFGTLAAMVARDAVLGIANPWRDLFDIDRTKVRGGAWDYVKENIDYPYYMLRDRLAGLDPAPLRAVRRGEGRVLSFDGEPVAAWRDPSGKLTLLSPVCTHMGCRVAWNN